MQSGCHCDSWGAGRHREAIGSMCLSFLIQALVPISPSIWWDFPASAPGSLRDWKPQRLGLGSRWSWFCSESAGTARCQEWSQTLLDAQRAQTGDWGQQPTPEPGRSSPCCSAPRSSGERNPTRRSVYGKCPQPSWWANTSQWNASLPTAGGQGGADLFGFHETGWCSTASKHTPYPSDKRGWEGVRKALPGQVCGTVCNAIWHPVPLPWGSSASGAASVTIFP